MGIKALLLLPAILAFPGYLHGVAALPGTLPGPDTLYRDSTYLRVINEGSTRLNCYLSYPQGGWRVESTYGNNSSELARLARFIRTSLSDSLIYVREITLTGYCSIEGSYAHNERLARRRANGFRNYLDSVFGLSRRYPVRTSYVGEDWERLRSLADSCASLPSRREVLEIIDNTGIFDGRERKLMALHGGVPYNFMLSELFPLLRRVEILVEYDLHRIIEERYRRKLSASELQEILAHERAVAAAEQERLAELRRLAAESRQRAEQLRLAEEHAEQLRLAEQRAAEPEQLAAQARLKQWETAARLAPVWDGSEKARLAAQQADRLYEQASDRLAQLNAQGPRWAQARKQLNADQQTAARLTVQLERQAEALQQYDRLEQAKAEQVACEQELERLQTAQQQAQTLEEQQAAALEKTQALADSLPAALAAAQTAQKELERWQQARKTLAEVRRQMQELVKLQKQEQAARQTLQQANDALDGAQQAYMSADQLYRRDQAGLLARELTPGQPCPVCGSVHHPSPARGVTGAPDKEQLEALATAMETARNAYNDALQTSSILTAQAGSAREQYIRLARQALAELEQELPPPEDVKALSRLVLDWDGRLDQLLEQAEALGQQRQAAVEAAGAAVNQLAGDREALEATRRQRSELREQQANAAARRDSAAQRAAELQATLPQASRAEAEATLSALEQQQKQLDESIRKTQQALEEYHQLLAAAESLQKERQNTREQADDEARQAAGRWEQALAKSGMDADAFAAARHTEEEIDRLRTELEQARRARQETEALYHQLSEQQKSAPVPGCMPGQLEQALEEQEQRRKALNDARTRITGRLNANRSTMADVRTAGQRLEKAQQRQQLIQQLDATANGKLSGGLGKQKFEQYVLATYFADAVEAANQRLFAMTGGRYQLECHQMTAAETQAALDLDVLDNYTGKLRSVGSLSGGETFQAALALALGLSDVIQNYAGGVELDVLFVDEGFGTLDAESLEQAVATLHSLVQGRRMVGIISHVPELKSRIENQLVVTKTPGGSTVALRRL